MAKKENLLYLFNRPLEPSFVVKGERRVAFNVPESYLTEKYKPIANQLSDTYADEAEEIIYVKEIKLPDISKILELDRNTNFSLFITKHQELAGALIDLFMGMKSIEDLQSLAVYARERVNPYLFQYALSVAILHRSDTSDLPIPSYIFAFPDKFIDSSVFIRAREEVEIVDNDSRIPIIIPMEFSATDLELEHRLFYFREDLGINLHHWHWHLVYPFGASLAITNKNRRGELFYYMHQQILARYNAERLCNKLPRVKRLIDWHEPIEEAYFSKLNSTIASRSYPPRIHNLKIRNVNREQNQLHVDIDDLIAWKIRIIDAIDSGFYIDANGNKHRLTENEGIDVLGNMVEASRISPNNTYYGNLHNFGHILISYMHDPDNKYLEEFAIMGDSAASMRDPVFYRWHGYIDYIFQLHKNSLPRYQLNQLNYEGITIKKVAIKSTRARDNILNTFWQQSDIDLSNGLNFTSPGSIFVRFTHLQHHSFTYNITVTNTGKERMGTCRIFLAPKYDEGEGSWLFRDQKNLFIALDRFTVNLKVGDNTIIRKSTESSVTIPFEQTFRDLNLRPPEPDNLQKFYFCGCGWPMHMLIPKGDSAGFPCELFVMISNYADDMVVQDNPMSVCKSADYFCGIKDRLYPDRRSMGYPFDRMPRPGVRTLQDFLTPNMMVQDIKIYFHDRILAPREIF